MKISNVRLEMLKWAYERAGYDERNAVNVFPRLQTWLSMEKEPTISQLRDFSSKFHVPYGYLFLQEPPSETIPFPMFRGTAGHNDRFDLNVYDTVLTVRSRQEWLEEYLPETGVDYSKLIGSAKLTTPIGEAVTILRNCLHLDAKWTFGLTSIDTAVNLLAQSLEDAGVFLTFNGVVGNNTSRHISVDECRGFTIVSDIAPYIFVNSSDSKSAQMFTLIHEAAHIMIRESAGHAGLEFVGQGQVENYCDRVAAEFLVPANILREIWSGDIRDLSRKFKVSGIVVARRAHDLGLITDEEFRRFWIDYKNRQHVQKKKYGGGDFYRTSVRRVGRLFAIHVRNAVNNRQLSYVDAYRLTGLNGNTYLHFMKKNI